MSKVGGVNNYGNICIVSNVSEFVFTYRNG